MNRTWPALSSALPLALLVGLFAALGVGLLATPYYLYALLPGSAVLALLALGRYPQVGYFFILFLIPYSAYRGFTASAPYLTVSKVVGVWLGLLLLAAVLLGKKVPLELRSNLWPWLALFLVANVGSVLMSGSPLAGVDTVRQILAAYLFFALSLIFLGRWRSGNAAIGVLVVSISIGALLSIAGYVFDIPFFAMNVESEAVRRATGLDQNPNHFAAFVLFSLPLLAHLFFTAGRRWVRLAALGLFGVNSVAIMLTYSRGGAVVFVCLLLLLAVAHLHRLKPRYLGFLAASLGLAVVAAIVILPASYWQRQRSVTDLADRSISRRISYLAVGWEAFQKNPVFGSGPGAFREIYAGSRYAPAYGKTPDEFRRYAHNTYLEVLVGTGVVGGALFFACIVRALLNFHCAKRLFQRLDQAEAASRTEAFALSFAGILLYFFLLSSQGHKYFWLSLALSEVALRVARAHEGTAAGDEPPRSAR